MAIWDSKPLIFIRWIIFFPILFFWLELLGYGFRLVFMSASTWVDGFFNFFTYLAYLTILILSILLTAFCQIPNFIICPNFRVGSMISGVLFLIFITSLFIVGYYRFTTETKDICSVVQSSAILLGLFAGVNKKE